MPGSRFTPADTGTDPNTSQYSHTRIPNQDTVLSLQKDDKGRYRSTWSPPLLDMLRQLWAEGLSAGKIARYLGRSKNSIVGKAHRLELPPRESPIKPLPPGAIPKDKEHRRTILLRIERKRMRDIREEQKRIEAAEREEWRRAHQHQLAERKLTVRPETQRRAGYARTCQHIEGTWSYEQAPRFCGAPSRMNCSYCEDHAARYLVRPRARHEDAAVADAA